MKQGIIANVRTIANDKQGKAINVVVIELSNGTAILRGLNQFKTDLSGSSRLLGRNLESITSVNHPAIQAELPALRGGGSVMGDFRMVKAGEEYTDENPNSPDFGKPKKYETDHIRVDGFLTIDPNPRYLQMELNAKATASFNAQLNGMFSSNDISATSSSDVSDEVPEELARELAGETATSDAKPTEPAK